MVKAKTELLTNNLLKYTAARAHKKAKAFWFSKEGIAKNKVLIVTLCKYIGTCLTQFSKGSS